MTKTVSTLRCRGVEIAQYIHRATEMTRNNKYNINVDNTLIQRTNADITMINPNSQSFPLTVT